ncbi:MAG TPA: valine--tRNA ligase [Firmicutes bacterium]|nr:valine--tRNA ligase [Bacillota bacterium]
METQYNPKEVETRIYRDWEDKKYFTPPDKFSRKSFCIVIPPPNVTGRLHMGHALNNTIQDILVRYKKLKGFKTIWVPGCDHAGIATHAVVEKELSKEGINRHEIGREEFLKRVWKWKDEYGDTIMLQLRRLGSALDWTRERFTMDEGLSRAVQKVFIELYEQGYIYKGKYIVNWCPGCKTAISNIETEYSEKKGSLWYIRYPVIKGSGTENRVPDYIVVATTRPETMLGDTAVAVNLKDKRYLKFSGLNVQLPLAGRKIPVIFDEKVEQGFGTGAVKVTPAHDPLDFEIGTAHELEMPLVIDETGKMTGAIPEKYLGLDRFIARKLIVKDLEEEGLIEKVEDYTHSVGHCDRCKTDIEPIISDQWFVKMEPLAKPAIEIVENGGIKFIPGKWKKLYLNWMYNIRDWCISRQLWWGHRIPIWYCTENNHPVASIEKPDKCPNCGVSNFIQEEDVLDTWFSSQLWPFSVFGWPEETEDLKQFYPTSVLATDRGIIFLWVARMIMAGLKFMGEKPFEKVMIHGTVLDELGRKMSKSLGNGIDPIEMIDEYGADAVRFSLMMLTSSGQDIYLSENKFKMGRNFANKLWNASRFVLMNVDNELLGRNWDFNNLELVDKWILSRLTKTVKEADDQYNKFNFNSAAFKIYDFVWKDFCDWYLELCKPKLNDPEKKGLTQYLLLYILNAILRILHPLMPFITEEIFQKFPEEFRDCESIMLSPFPKPVKNFIDDYSEWEMDLVIEVINRIRNIRAEMLVPLNKEIEVLIKGKNMNILDFLRNHSHYIKSLTRAEAVELGSETERPAKSAVAVVNELEIFIPLGKLIDIDKEKERVLKNIKELEGFLTSAEKKLSNPNFIGKAPADIVNKEKAKKEELELKIKKLKDNLECMT